MSLPSVSSLPTNDRAYQAPPNVPLLRPQSSEHSLETEPVGGGAPAGVEAARFEGARLAASGRSSSLRGTKGFPMNGV